MFQIEKNIPVPSIRISSLDFPFKDMEVGDSFSVPVKNRSSVRTAATAYSKGNIGTTFVVRVVDAENVRIWRTS